MEASNNKVPKHIGIIMDGNRRFAKRLMLKPWKGHEWGAKKLEKVFEWCNEIGVKELTLYTFSVDNFNRPKEEFDYLMNLFREEFDKLKEDKRIFENKIRINVIGRIWMFPGDIQEKMEYIMRKTKEHDNFVVNFAMAYGGRAEVIDAVKKVAEQVKKGELGVEQINEDVFSRNLYLNSDPDLVIRTGGEHRTSSFLIWQSDYSELMFIDKLWPEFEKEDFLKCIQEFGERDRRFGK